MSSSSLFKIFIAYSRKDEEMLSELRVHLNPLERSSNLHVWYDGKIEPGAVWDDTIKLNLHKADLVLLLISASAIASDYFYEQEVKEALERHEQGKARVVPLILKPCAWQVTPLGQLQALPKDGKPVTKWLDRDDAYNNAVLQLWKIFKEQELKREESQRRKEERKQAELEAQKKREDVELEETPSIEIELSKEVEHFDELKKEISELKESYSQNELKELCEIIISYGKNRTISSEYIVKHENLVKSVTKNTIRIRLTDYILRLYRNEPLVISKLEKYLRTMLVN